jgi:hypothetical protein
MTPPTPGPLPGDLQTAIDALTVALDHHPLIQAAWLEGSVGRGTADRYSDLDLHLLLRPADRPAFVSGAEAWLGAIWPLVLFNSLFGGQMLTALTAQGLRLDLWPQVEAPLLDPDRVRVLLDRDQVLSFGPSSPPDPAQTARQLVGVISEFWRCLSLLPAVIGRGERLVAVSGLSVELNLVTELLIARSGQRRDRGVKHLNAYLPVDTRAQLETLMALPDLEPQTLVNAHLGLVAQVQRVGPELAGQHGFAYPVAQEAAVLSHVQAELARLDLALPAVIQPF